jgi:hypothetical protein
MTRQYFVVGASSNDEHNLDLTEKFISRGYWEMSQYLKSTNNSKKMRLKIDDKSIERYDHISVGDRIAIKRMNGMGSDKVIIMAIGIVTDLDENEYRIYVDWKKVNMQKKVDSRGCFARIHGPYTINESEEARNWLNEIFRL